MRQKHLRLSASLSGLTSCQPGGEGRCLGPSTGCRESDGRWIKGWWDGYQGLKCSDYDEDWLAGFHAGLIAARLDDVGAGELVPNDFYGQESGWRENEKRAEFLGVLYHSRGRKNGLFTGLTQEWFEREREDWLEQESQRW